jgi:hypothetical protein
LYTEEEKKRWFGDGEWVKEPDRVTFERKGIRCLVARVVKRDGPDHIFGGYLCGYCVLPDDHPWIGKQQEDIPAEVHGGITYAESKSKGTLIGFDCAHSEDEIPSMTKANEDFKKMLSGDFGPDFAGFGECLGWAYRNIDYVVEQCKQLAGQIWEAMAKHRQRIGAKKPLRKNPRKQ